jgi:pseudouridine synthase
MEERLQKILAQAGLASRRSAERIIKEGRVKINGTVADQLGVKADPETDMIEVDGRVLNRPEAMAYYMFYKPEGFITSMNDPQGRPTVAEFLNSLPERVYPVGRLDQDAEGLLLLTNDGELARRLMHPRFHVPKVYRVKVRGIPNQAAIRLLKSGRIVLGTRPVAPAEVELIKTGQDRAWLKITLIEGRHRQVKRMCSYAGHPVMKLKRVAYGSLDLGRLASGQIRPLKKEEIASLQSAVGLR